MLPIIGKSYSTQQYGLTPYAQSSAGRIAYKNFPGGIHPGVDFGTGGITAECIALVEGTIVRASLDGGWGNHVELQGADGWRRQYAHLSSIKVPVGAQVKPGDVLGRVGTTGASTGIHLHYGNRRRTLMMTWEYRDPSADFEDKKPPTAPKITSRLIKGNGPALTTIYVYNGKGKFRVPDIETLRFLFGAEAYELVDNDVLTKIPEGLSLPSLK